MPSKPRSYFYPVLSSFSSDYRSGISFEVEIQARIVEEGPVKNQVALKYEINLNSAALRDLIIDRRATFALDCYCGDTMFRELYKFSDLKGEIRLPATSIKGKLEVQPLIVVTDSTAPFILEDISQEYFQNTFDLEIGAPLAIASSIAIPIDFAFNSIKEMVKIRLDETRDKNTYFVDLTGEQIVVYMGENAHKVWNSMSNDPEKKPTLFFSVYKDCITTVLEALIRDSFESDYRWMDYFKEELNIRKIYLPSQDASFSQINELSLKILGSKGYERLISRAS